MPFTLPDLPYPANALEPVIDARTMEIHREKHHNAYVTNLNKAVAGTSWEQATIEDLCTKITQVPDNIRTAVRNNGGGHYNHTLFWTLLAPKGEGGQRSGELDAAINKDLGGYDKFKEAFTTAATTRFGSGWAWLCVTPEKKLAVCSTPNQDNPLMQGLTDCLGRPVLGLDVWEHAYYLNYQNRRPDYIAAFFDVINWGTVSKLYAAAVK